MFDELQPPEGLDDRAALQTWSARAAQFLEQMGEPEQAGDARDLAARLDAPDAGRAELGARIEQLSQALMVAALTRLRDNYRELLAPTITLLNQLPADSADRALVQRSAEAYEQAAALIEQGRGALLGRAPNARLIVTRSVQRAAELLDEALGDDRA